MGIGVSMVGEAAEEVVLDAAAESACEGAASSAAEMAVSAATEGASEGALGAATDGVAEEMAGGIAEEVATGAGETTAEGVTGTVAEGTGETVTEGAGQTAAESTGDTAGKEAGESAGEAGESRFKRGVAAAQKYIGMAVEKLAGSGVSVVVRQVVTAFIVCTMIQSLIKSAIAIYQAFESSGKIQKVLHLLHKAIGDAKSNMKDWNDQIKLAMRSGKMTDTIVLPDGIAINAGALFSAEMNSCVAKFLDGVQPAMIKVGTVSSKKPSPKIEDLDQAVVEAKDAFLEAARPFLLTVKRWDSTDDSIKRAAGVDFHVKQLEENVEAIRNAEV